VKRTVGTGHALAYGRVRQTSRVYKLQQFPLRHAASAATRPRHIDERTAALIFWAAMKTGKKQTWRDHGSPKDEEGKMEALIKTKASVVLVGFSVLAVWMLLGRVIS